MGREFTLEIEPAEILGEFNDVEQRNAPDKLYLQGDMNLFRLGRKVSVVGSRDVSVEGIKRTRALVKSLVDNNVTVISGLAAGVDTVAHETALAVGGFTAAVIGTPLSHAYPKSKWLEFLLGTAQIQLLLRVFRGDL